MSLLNITPTNTNITVSPNMHTPQTTNKIPASTYNLNTNYEPLLLLYNIEVQNTQQNYAHVYAVYIVTPPSI